MCWYLCRLWAPRILPIPTDRTANPSAPCVERSSKRRKPNRTRSLGVQCFLFVFHISPGVGQTFGECSGKILSANLAYSFWRFFFLPLSRRFFRADVAWLCKRQVWSICLWPPPFSSGFSKPTNVWLPPILPLLIAIVHGYVQLPEGILWFIIQIITCQLYLYRCILTPPLKATLRKEEAEAIDEDFDPPENEKAPGLGSWVLLWWGF